MITLSYHVLCIAILIAVFIGAMGNKAREAYREHRRQKKIIRDWEAKQPKALKRNRSTV